MKYISTRSLDDPVSARQMALGTLAGGGGLYIPQSWPTLLAPEIEALRGHSFAAIAGRILAPFLLDDHLTDQDLAFLLDQTFGPTQKIFNVPGIAPLVPLSESMSLLELFHGPTLAFKDIALQFLARLIDHYLKNKDNRPVTFLGATSGDTGSAAIHACAGVKNANIFILHPAKNISEIQRRQMTTFPSSRVFNIAIEGTFDDCQALVKTLLSDSSLAGRLGFIPINSINFIRILVQSVYYFTAALALPASSLPPSFVVPTGNFGNVFAGYVARQMGLKIGRLVVATNHNDILYRFFKTGEMAIDRVIPSYSPSMDIQVSSNFERFLFDLTGRDPRIVSHLMDGFKQRGNFRVTTADHIKAGSVFATGRASNSQTVSTIKSIYDETGLVIDPHTAVGLHVARELADASSLPPGPIIALACAHPSKFPDTIHKALSFSPPLPESLRPILTLPERITPIRNDLGIVKNYISGIVGA